MPRPDDKFGPLLSVAVRSVLAMDMLLLAGLWLDAEAWGEVVPELERRGHRAVPLTLPGQGAEPADATLDDLRAAVVAAVDEMPGPVIVVGHSASCTLAWLAADARPDKVVRAVLVGGFPTSEDDPYFSFIEPVDGWVRFPGWEAFAGADSDDLDEETQRRVEAAAIPVPEALATARVHYADERRFDVPVTMVCPEYSAEQARQWVESGEAGDELRRVATLDYVDIDSGHWPMFSQPGELAAVLDEVARG